MPGNPPAKIATSQKGLLNPEIYTTRTGSRGIRTYQAERFWLLIISKNLVSK
jgi:hypothetical protein